MTIFEDYATAAWEVDGEKYAFMAQVVSSPGSNRLVKRTRPFKIGEKIDNTGSNAREWMMTIIFSNEVIDPGLTEINGTLPMYPGVLNALELMLNNKMVTGNLTVPTIGVVRAQALSWRRIESAELRDAANMEIQWCEDNEDDLAFRTAVNVTVESNGKELADSSSFDAGAAGVAGEGMDDFTNGMENQETNANSPEDTALDTDTEDRKVANGALQTVQRFSNPGVSGRSVFTVTAGNRTERKLTIGVDMSHRATNAAGRGRPKLAAVVIKRNTSIAALAASLQQDPEDLIAANPMLDPLHIRPGVTVKIYRNDGLVR